VSEISRRSEEFTPKLVSTLVDGYSLSVFRKDTIAGLRLAIVALLLSMVIAIAIHAKPEQGLYLAIVGGLEIGRELK
jgi:SulP family sulfate permease